VSIAEVFTSFVEPSRDCDRKEGPDMASPEMFLQQLADAARSMQEKTSTQEMLDEAVQIAI
jgi:hypothetical protein